MTKLSDSQRVILSAAAQHEMGLARAPKTLPAAARNAVFRSLIKNNLLTEINAPREHVGLGWRQDEDGTWIVARITDEGLRAIGIEPEAPEAPADQPEDTRPRDERNGVDPRLLTGIDEDDDTAPTDGEDATPQDQDAPAADSAQAAPERAPRATLRDAAAAFLAAWDACPAQDATDNPISRAVEELRVALAGKPARTPREAGAPRKPREGTKQETVLALLRREEGATIAQIVEATGWQQHTVRGFFAGLKKRQGIEVKVLERIRQVGPNKEGAKGSFTIYRVD
jgi:hypothetical protein